jgi:hypothetical protein
MDTDKTPKERVEANIRALREKKRLESDAFVVCTKLVRSNAPTRQMLADAVSLEGLCES